MRKICVDRAVIAVFFFVVLTPALWAQASVPSAIPSDSDRLAKVEQQVADAKASADNAWMLTSAALVLFLCDLRGRGSRRGSAGRDGLREGRSAARLPHVLCTFLHVYR